MESRGRGAQSNAGIRGAIGLSVEREVARQRVRLVVAIALCMVPALWVHWRSLASFFTSPDDLVYLEQASGLVLTPFKLFRVLSEVLYFRVMFEIVGLQPFPFHAVTMVLHLANIALVFLFARALGIGGRTAALGATSFGMFPLFSTVLSSAVGINDELALALALSALLALRLKGLAGILAPVVLFALGMLSKESVIFLPLLAFIPAARDPGRSRLPGAGALVGISVVSVALLMIVRPIRLVPEAIYAVRFGPNLFHNLMTYMSWSVNVANPLPDLVSSYDPRAWRVGIWVVLGALASWRAFGRAEPAIRIGSAWYVLGLLPVLPLEHLTYRHYLYPAIPGLALVVAGTVVHSMEWLVRRAMRESAGGRVAFRIAAVLATAGVLAYAVAAERLVRQRLDARVAGTELALDPVYRRQEFAEQALVSLGRQIRPEQRQIGILLPEGTGRVFGARSGREYRQAQPGRPPYDLLEESLDHGRAIQLYFPWVDSVAFIDRWTGGFRNFDLFIPYRGGHLAGVGKGPASHGEVARWMMENHWYAQARDHLRSVLEVYPSDAGLRLGYGAALFRSGDREGAIAQLEEVIRTAPGDSAAIAARAVLAKLDSASAK